MTISLSALILPFADLEDNTAVALTGAQTLAEAGAVRFDGSLQLSPVFLPHYYTTLPSSISVNIIGAQVNADEGTVTVELPVVGVFSQLGPLILPGQLRNIQPSGIGNIDVVVIGAKAEAQGETMEGADATIYIDGATAFIDAGAVIGAAILVTEAVSFQTSFDTNISFTAELTAGLTQQLSYTISAKWARE